MPWRPNLGLARGGGGGGRWWGGQGRKTGGLPGTPTQLGHHPVPLSTPPTPPCAPLHPTPGEDEEGHPQTPDPAGGTPGVGLSPEHPKPSLGATVPAQRCREPPVTHSSRQRHPPSGCLRGITQLLPSALIQGLNIPGPGIKIGTIWEGPESAASAAGTHRHPPRHARHPPGSPRATWGIAGFGDTRSEGEPPESCVYPGATLVPAGANSQALRGCSVSPRGDAVPKGGWCPRGTLTRPQGDNCTHVIPGR